MAIQVAHICVDCFLIPLCEEIETLHQLHEVLYLLLVVFEAYVDPLYLVDEIVERLLCLGIVPIKGRL